MNNANAKVVKTLLDKDNQTTLSQSLEKAEKSTTGKKKLLEVLFLLLI